MPDSSIHVFFDKFSFLKEYIDIDSIENVHLFRANGSLLLKNTQDKDDDGYDTLESFFFDREGKFLGGSKYDIRYRNPLKTGWQFWIPTWVTKEYLKKKHLGCGEVKLSRSNMWIFDATVKESLDRLNIMGTVHYVVIYGDYNERVSLYMPPAEYTFEEWLKRTPSVTRQNLDSRIQKITSNSQKAGVYDDESEESPSNIEEPDEEMKQ